MINKEDVVRVVTEQLIEWQNNIDGSTEDAFDEWGRSQGFEDGTIAWVVANLMRIVLAETGEEIEGEHDWEAELNSLLRNLFTVILMAFLMGWDVHKQLGAPSTSID